MTRGLGRYPTIASIGRNPPWSSASICCLLSTPRSRWPGPGRRFRKMGQDALPDLRRPELADRYPAAQLDFGCRAGRLIIADLGGNSGVPSVLRETMGFQFAGGQSGADMNQLPPYFPFRIKV